MLLLSCMPCGDSSDCSVEEKVSVVLNDSDHQDHEDEENCTPFCVCACCAAPVFQAQAVIAIKKFSQQIVLNIYPEEKFFSASFGNIWQPPKG
ncbi:MAG: hypothetical protein H7Y86_22315 [Rhizobacter sp.]|nr:hypothetical protein [Ferruginibacter sp.]